MRHFVAYHSVDIMGEEYTPGEDFHFISRKSLKYLSKTQGNTVWAFSGKRNKLRRNDYSLIAVFYPEDVFSDEDDDKLKHIWGWEGDYFDPPIRVNEFEWFQILLKQQSNFSLGINEINDISIIQHLESVYYRSGIAPTLLHPDELYEDETIREGKKKTVYVNVYERSAKGRVDCIGHYGPNCVVCGFSFEEFYGDIGSGFIHIHHRVPISQIRAEYVLDPVRDLVPVCPNCHVMLHRGDELLSVEQLRDIITNTKGGRSQQSAGGDGEKRGRFS